MLAPQRDVARFELRRESSEAVAEALRIGAQSLLPPGPARERFVRQAKRIDLCAQHAFATVTSFPEEGTRMRFSSQRACGHRLCLLDQAIAARKSVNHLRNLVDAIWEKHPDARAMMLTTTMQNRPIEQVGQMWRDQTDAIKRLFKMSRILAANLGHFTALEVAVRGTEQAPQAGVHSHSLVIIETGALSDRRYIPQKHYVRMFREAARLAYSPIVDIRLVRSATGATDKDAVKSACIEIAKYICKPTGFIISRPDGTFAVNPHVALALARGLFRRRPYIYDRCFREAAKALKRRAG